MARVSVWAASGQREVQNAMAGSLRALKGGQPGAMMGLMGLCFAYGFFHAAGPGHGKLLIGGYGLARGGTALRLAGIALLASLGQALSAVLLVRAGIALLDWSRERLTSAAETLFAPLSWAAVGLIGLWLVLRATRRLWRDARRSGHDQDHHHHDHAHDHDAHCGHRHGPTTDEVARLTGLRDAVVLIGAIAIRPCTGALFLLIITWRMGIPWQGVAGTFAMAAGTASVTVAVALAAVVLRRGAFDRLSHAMPGDRSLLRAGALVEATAGLLIAITAATLLMRAI